VDHVMECIGHGVLKISLGFIKSKGHDMIRKSPPKHGKGSFVLILLVNSDLIILEEPIHEGYDSKANAFIDHLSNERSREIIFRLSLIKIEKIKKYSNGSILLVDGDTIEHLGCIGNWVDKIGCV